MPNAVVITPTGKSATAKVTGLTDEMDIERGVGHAK